MTAPQQRRFFARGLTAGALALALSALGLGATATADTRPPVPTTPTTVSADALPTWQLTGVVWSQVVVGTTVYATGSFTKARPPGVGAGGAGEITVGHLFAYDITTGNRIASFNHTLDAQGLAITASPDGTRIYVGGDFTTVDGQVRQHVAAFDTATGNLIPSFAPVVNGQVKALAATNSTVYVGGAFESAAGVTRRRLASFTTSGALNPWAPKADDGYVYSLLVAPGGGKVIVGGQFGYLNGVLVRGMGAVDTTQGGFLPWAANSTIRDYGGGAINSLTTDGTYVYGSGFAFGGNSSFEGTFSLNPADGTIRWLVDCQGDSYDIEVVGQLAYTASHAHNCSMIGGFPDTSPRTRWQHSGAFTSYPTQVNNGPDMYGWNYKGIPAPTLLHWFPKLGIGTATGQYQAAWNVVSGGRYIAMGGEFPTVNGKGQQGLTRYALPDTAAGVPANKVGPQYLDTVPVRNAAPATTASVPTPGTIRVSYGTAWDMDNTRLTYQLYRDRGTAGETLVNTRTVDTNFWTLPTQTVDDLTAPSGTHTYQVRITDPFGNQLLSPVSNGVSTTGNAAPTAAFNATTSGLTVNVDASASTDSDGTIASYAWAFGDGGTATGRTASRTYATAGTYEVRLTVTDNAGATSTTTRSVTVAATPPAGVLASDTFNRTVASGWGSADVGGAYAYAGSTTLFSVANGTGSIRLNAGSGPGARLPVSSTDTDLQFSFAFDKAPTNGSNYVRALGRGTEANGYKANVWKSSTSNTMNLSLTRVISNAETTLVSKALTTSFAAGTSYNVRMQTWGTGTTNLRARVWRTGTTEPTTWDVSTTDTTAALQAAGGVGVQGYLSSSTTNAPLALSVQGLSARRTGN